MAIGGGALPRHPVWCVLGWQRGDQQLHLPRRSAAPGARDARFREGFAQFARLGLSFESWQYHPQLSDAIDLARTCSDTTIILNHVGSVGKVGPYRGHRQEIRAA